MISRPTKKKDGRHATTEDDHSIHRPPKVERAANTQKSEKKPSKFLDTSGSWSQLEEQEFLVKGRFELILDHFTFAIALDDPRLQGFQTGSLSSCEKVTCHNRGRSRATKLPALSSQIREREPKGIDGP